MRAHLLIAFLALTACTGRSTGDTHEYGSGGASTSSSSSSGSGGSSFTSSSGGTDGGLQRTLLVRSIADIETTAEDDIVVVGIGSGSPDLGSGADAGQSNKDMQFVARYGSDLSGKWQNLSHLTTSSGFLWGVNRVTVDGNGRTWAVGAWEGEVEIGAQRFSNANNDHAFVIALAPDGAIEHVLVAEGGESLEIDSIAADASQVLLTGLVQGTVNFAGQAIDGAQGSRVLIALDLDGSFRALDQWRNGALSMLESDGAGGFFVGGGYGPGGLDALGIDAPALASGAASVLVKLRGDRSVAWHRTAQSDDGIFFRSLSHDGAGGLLATGAFKGTSDIFGEMHTSAGNTDIFLTSWDAEGTTRFVRTFGDADFQTDAFVAPLPGGRIAMLVQLSGTISLGGDALMASSAGNMGLATFEADGTPRSSRVLPVSGVSPVFASLSNGDVVVGALSIAAFPVQCRLARFTP